MTENKRLILVLGMHRSGTSAITKALEILGVSLGDDLLGPSHDNKKGFFEDTVLYEFNKEILEEQGRDWFSLTPQNFESLSKKEQNRHIDACVKILARKFEDTALFGMKDPRSCRLLPFWQAVTKKMGIDLSYVIAIRNPANVVASLEKRNRLPATISYLLWLSHMAPVVLDTQKSQHVVVDYDMLLEQPRAQLERMGGSLNLMMPDEQAFAQYEGDFLDPSLRNQATDFEAFNGDITIDSRVRSMFRFLQRSATDEGELHSKSLIKLARDYLRWAEDSHEWLLSMDEITANLQAANRWITKVQTQAREANSIHKAEIKTKDEELFQTHSHNARLRQQIEAIYASRRWQMTEPFARMKNFLVKGTAE